MMDRRKFFKACAAVLASAALPTACSQSGGGDNAANDVETTDTTTPEYSKLLFSELPSTVFSVSHDIYGVIDMRLADVGDELFTPESEQFSVTLAGPVNPVFSEASYDIYNETLGNISLYLQPSEVLAGEQRYRIAFSLLKA